MKRAARLLRRLAAAAACLLALTGCWSSVELNNRAFVNTVIIDDAAEGLELTLSFTLTSRLIPGQTGGTGGGGQRPVAFITRSGNTIEEALQKVQGDIPRRIAFGQTHSIILGRRFAEKGISRVIEFVSRNPILKLNTSLFVVDGSAREKVASSPVYFERFFISVLNGYLRNNQVMNTNVRDMMFMSSAGGDGVIPILKFTGLESSQAGPDNAPSVGTGGAAIFRAGKLVQPLLTPEETSGARAIRSQLKQYIFNINSPTDGQNIGLYTTSLRTRIKPFKANGRLGIKVIIYSDIGIVGSDSDIDLSDENNLRLVQKEIEQLSNRTVTNVIAKTQQAGADVFKFAGYVAIRYPREWLRIRHNWRDYYKNDLLIQAESVTRLHRVGSATEAFRDKYMQ